MRHLRFDVGARPFLVLFELTRACELACKHCRAEAVLEPHSDELSTAEVQAVLDDLASLGSPRPIVVFTGGDPLKRGDLVSLVKHGADLGLSVAVSPAGTPRANYVTFSELRNAGASNVSLSIDGSSSETHDAFRRVDGSFEWTLAACLAAREVGLKLQVNTTVSTETVHDLPAICRLVAKLGVSLWSVFFLVPTGRARSLSALSATETEDVLAFLYDAAAYVPLKTTEAPQFRRFMLGNRGAGTALDPGPLYKELRRSFDQLDLGSVIKASSSSPLSPESKTGHRRSLLNVGDGRGVIFISHRGEVQPSGFLPLVVGNVRHKPLSEIYANSIVLRSLRDVNSLSGRCGICDLAKFCGGSRAQAYARNGDPLGEDPTCAYEPFVSAKKT